MLKLDNRGFTLVELLAVIVILVAISYVAVSGIGSSLENRDKKECVEQQELAVGAAKIYFSLNGSTSVTVGNLKAGNYLKEGNKVDRLSDDDEIRLDNANNKYLYEGNEVGKSCN